MIRLRGASVTALLVAALVLTACGRDQPPVVGTTVIGAADREALPGIAGTTIDGAPLDLASLRGRVVVLNSWASWCEPCRTEVPVFVRLASRIDPADVAVVGLDVSDDAGSAKEFEKDFGMTYPSIVDKDAAVLRTIPGVPPSALPSTVILDRHGRIAVRVIGEVDPAKLPGLVAQVAAEK